MDADVINRKCHACGRHFKTRAGSLIRNCSREECRQQRRAATRHNFKVETERRKRFEHLQADAEVRSCWPEIESCLEEVADIGPPTPADLARAVKHVGKARGAYGRRNALVHLSAIALRWAGTLPRSESVEVRGVDVKAA